MLSLWYMYLGYIEYRPNGSKGNVESAKSNEKTDKPEPPKKVEPPKVPEPKKVEPIKPPEPPKPVKAPEIPKAPIKNPEPPKPVKAPEIPKMPEPPKKSGAEERFLAAERTFGTPTKKPDTKNANVMKNFRITTPETSDDEEMISEIVEDSEEESEEDIEFVKPKKRWQTATGLRPARPCQDQRTNENRKLEDS